MELLNGVIAFTVYILWIRSGICDSMLSLSVGVCSFSINELLEQFFINPVPFFRYLNLIKSKSLSKLCIITFDALSAKLIGSLLRRQPKFFIKHSGSIVFISKTI